MTPLIVDSPTSELPVNCQSPEPSFADDFLAAQNAPAPTPAQRDALRVAVARYDAAWFADDAACEAYDEFLLTKPSKARKSAFWRDHRAAAHAALCEAGDAMEATLDDAGLSAVVIGGWAYTSTSGIYFDDFGRHVFPVDEMVILDGSPIGPVANVNTPPAPCCPAEATPCLGCQDHAPTVESIPRHLVQSVIRARPGDRTIGDDARETQPVALVEPPVCQECGERHDPEYDHESDPASWDGQWADEVWGTDEPSFADEWAAAVGLPVLDSPADDDDDQPEGAWNRLDGSDIGWPKLPARSYFLKPAPKPLPRPLPASGSYTLDGLADAQGDAYAALGNAVGNLFAKHMRELASNIRAVSASSVADFESRIVEMDRQRDEDLRMEAYAAGYDSAMQAVGC